MKYLYPIIAYIAAVAATGTIIGLIVRQYRAIQMLSGG